MLEPPRFERKRLLLLALLGSMAILLLLKLGGAAEGWRLVQKAKGEFILLALLAESLRYLGVALLTQTLAGFLGREIALLPTVAAVFAGTSINRLFAAGGLGSMYIRYRYLEKNDLSLGSVSILFLLQYIISALILLTTFLSGLLYLLTHRGLSQGEILASGLVVAAVLGGFVYLVRLYRQRRKLEGVALNLYRKASGLLGRLLKRNLYNEAGLRRTISRLYASVRLATRNPWGLLAAFSFGALTLLADILCLYFTFSALGLQIHPGIVVIGYTAANYAGAASFLPDGLLVTDGSLALVYTGLAVPQRVAAMAILIFRFISYWLPIPLGFLALWLLRRRSLL